MSASKVAILDESHNCRVLEGLESTTAPLRVYPGAIYLHQGESYLISHLDLGIVTALPLFAMCDRFDIGGLSRLGDQDTDCAHVFIYGAILGGAGISEKGFALLSRLWEATLSAISKCPCHGGCPSCIQSPKCANNNEPFDKEAAILILQALLGDG
jgi:DEAD/DEAH box helicase domain-containing protein